LGVFSSSVLRGVDASVPLSTPGLVDERLITGLSPA
jgi:hypothetical protein